MKNATTEAYVQEDLFYSVKFVLVEDKWASLKILFYCIWKPTTGVKNVSLLLSLKSQMDEVYEIFLLEVRVIFGFVEKERSQEYIIWTVLFCFFMLNIDVSSMSYYFFLGFTAEKWSDMVDD